LASGIVGIGLRHLGQAEFACHGVGPEADAVIGIRHPASHILLDPAGPAIENLGGHIGEPTEGRDVPRPGAVPQQIVVVPACLAAAAGNLGTDDLPLGHGQLQLAAGLIDVALAAQRQDVGIAMRGGPFGDLKIGGLSGKCGGRDGDRHEVSMCVSHAPSRIFSFLVNRESTVPVLCKIIRPPFP
jgi:hypothetical protein